MRLGGISILQLPQGGCALKTARQCFLFVSLKLHMWCLYALMLNLMLKPNYMLAKDASAKSHCRTLDDGLLNWLALKDDVMVSECAKLKPPRLALRIVLSTRLPGAGWLIGFARPSSKMLTSQAAFVCEQFSSYIVLGYFQANG